MTIYFLNSNCTAEQVGQVITSLQREYSGIDIKELSGSIDTQGSFDSESLLVICFTSGQLSSSEVSLVNRYKESAGQLALIVPISFGPDNFLDVNGLSGIKSQSASEHNWLANTTNRIGAFLGLRCIPKDNQIFISYKKSDGEEIAKAFSEHLTNLGFKIWRDENRDEDNEGMLTVGLDVQHQIKSALLCSNLMLLVDTPQCPDSFWVNEEINMALANLVPILPVCIRTDGKKGSHFRKLRTLNRFSEVDISLNSLNDLSNELFLLLAEVYKRKRRLPEQIAIKFRSAGYSWSPVNEMKLLFESSKKRKFSSQHKLLSHCPIYDGIHDELLANFIGMASSLSKIYNDRVFVYDGRIHTEAEIGEIINGNPNFERANIILLHHEQVEEYLRK